MKTHYLEEIKGIPIDSYEMSIIDNNINIITLTEKDIITITLDSYSKSTILDVIDK